MEKNVQKRTKADEKQILCKSSLKVMVEQRSGHIFITSSSSHFFNTTDPEQYLLKENLLSEIKILENITLKKNSIPCGFSESGKTLHWTKAPNISCNFFQSSGL